MPKPEPLQKMGRAANAPGVLHFASRMATSLAFAERKATMRA
jgi:hypothetical protein